MRNDECGIGKMRNDECGMMNAESAAAMFRIHHSAFIIPHSTIVL